ncbi:unnamed protein product [Brassica rapa subsp. trilocularis]
MASSDVVLAHSAFDALRLGRSPQIIVGPQAKKPSQISKGIYKLHQILTYCATHNDMCAAHPIHLYLSTLTITGESSGNIKVKTRVPPKPIARIPAASASSFEVFVDEEEESTE